MLRNYITIALRHLRQNRIFSVINVLGLAIGLACFILISLYVWNELHYDTYPAAADDIYRVEIHLTTNGGVEVYPTTDVAVGEGITGAFSQVKGGGDGVDRIGYGEFVGDEGGAGESGGGFAERVIICVIWAHETKQASPHVFPFYYVWIAGGPTGSVYADAV
jgi:hypothetical protein